LGEQVPASCQEKKLEKEEKDKTLQDKGCFWPEKDANLWVQAFGKGLFLVGTGYKFYVSFSLPHNGTSPLPKLRWFWEPPNILTLGIKVAYSCPLDYLNFSFLAGERW
jgi:hypothetical protein